MLAQQFDSLTFILITTVNSLHHIDLIIQEGITTWRMHKLPLEDWHEQECLIRPNISRV